MLQRTLVVLGVLCTLARAAVQAAEPTRLQLPDFSCTRGAHSIRLPARLSELRALGPLQKQTVVRTEQWDGYKAIEIAYQFPGLVVAAVTFTNEPERYNLSLVRIHDARWTLSPFRVGQPAEPALRRAGAKGPIHDGSWHIDGVNDGIDLQVKGGRIADIVYDCYTG